MTKDKLNGNSSRRGNRGDSESGRSMVEILGVLAIMGLLSLGAISGYRYAVDKSVANDIINEVDKRAVIGSSQIMAGLVFDLSEFWGDNPYDVIRGFEADGEAPYGRNPDFFAITTYDIPEGVCARVMDSDYHVPSAIAVNSVVATDKSACTGSADDLYDITFIYPNAMGDAEYADCRKDSDCPKGLICNQNTKTCMLMPDGIKDKDGLTHNCDAKKLIDVSGVEENCNECPNRQTLSCGARSYCTLICDEGEFVDESGRCIDCDATGGYRYPDECGQNDGLCTPFCPNRMMLAKGGHASTCFVKECPDNYFLTINGCYSCDEKSFVAQTWWSQTSTQVCLNSCPNRASGNANGFSGCYLKTCPAGYFHDRNYNCKSCTDTAAISINNSTKQSCLDCRDNVGEPNRGVLENYCILLSDCPNGRQEDDPTTEEDESFNCKPCAEGYYPRGKTCLPCDDPVVYQDVTATECAYCSGVRSMRYTDKGNWAGASMCLKIAEEDEFYCGSGTWSCDSDKKPILYAQPSHCYMCDNRVMAGVYCVRSCNAGEFMGADGSCYSCDTPQSVAWTTTKNANGIVQQYCSSVCPGQRYRQKSGAVECRKCPAGTYSVGADATSCEKDCPVDLSGVDKGVCIACGGSWQNGSCGEACPAGQYNKNGVCQSCPEDLGSLTGSGNEPICLTCGGIWNNLGLKCCPKDLTTLKNKSDCEKCYGLWNKNSCTKCPNGQYGSEGQCINCAGYEYIANRLNCLACGGTWSQEVCLPPVEENGQQ